MKKFSSFLFLILISIFLFTSNQPSIKASSDPYVSIVTGRTHTIALTQSGNVFTWGYNDMGQLGDGTTITSYRSVNITESGDLSGVIASGDKIVFVDAEGKSNLLISEQGRVFVFGEDNSGNLANGSYADQHSPDEITGRGALANLDPSDKIVTGSISDYVLLLVSDSGRVFSVGSKNQNAYSSSLNQSLPVEITNQGALNSLDIEDKIVYVDSNYNGLYTSRNIYISSTGRVFINGGQTWGTLGNGSTSSSLVYTPIEITENGELHGIIASGDKVVKAHAGGTFTYLLTENHQVFGFGLTNAVQIVDYTSYATTPSSIMYRLSLNTGEYIVDMQAGYSSGALLTNQNRILTLGSNYNGEAGVNSTANMEYTVSDATQYGDFSGQSLTFSGLTGESGHFIAYDNNDQIYAWGNVDYGAFGANPNIFTNNILQATNIDNFNLIQMSFNSNGGSSVSTISQLEDSAITPPSNPTKDGYTFDGWYADSELTIPYIIDTMPSEDITLYAKWVTTTFSISYELDGALDNTNPANYTIIDDTITLSDVSKEGSTFAGWFTDASFTNEVTEITTGSFGNVTLYAKFVSLPPQISLTSTTVEASQYSSDILDFLTFSDDETLNEDLIVSVTFLNYNFYAYDYTFFPNALGDFQIEVTATDEDGNQTTELFDMSVVDTTPIAFYDDSGETPVERTSMDFYYFIDAQDYLTLDNSVDPYISDWERISVSYEMVGLQFGESEIMDVFASITVPGQYDLIQYFDDGSNNISEFTYHFTYIYLTDIFDYAPNFNLPLNSSFNVNNLSLHSDFSQYTLNISSDLDTAFLGTYSVSFELYDEINDDIIFDGDYVLIVTDQDVFPPVVTTTDFNIEAGFPIEDFSTYNGYYTVSDDSEYSIDFSDDINYDVPGDYTLTLTVTDAFDNVTVAELTVTVLPFELKNLAFNEAGGTSVDDQHYYYLDTIVLPEVNPTKEGYTFGGWYTTPHFDEPFTLTSMPNLNITVYAYWIPNQYTVTFDTNGGSLIDPVTQDYLSYVIAPTAPTYTGFTFDAWYTDDTYLTVYHFNTMPNHDVTLYANWIRNTYTVYFHPNNGSSFSYINQPFDTMVMPPEDPIYEGYTFNGWYLDSELTQPYSFGAMPANIIHLYAKWSLNQYSITFDSAGGSAVSAITQDYQSDVSTPANPTKEGYTFNGWDQSVPATMPSNDLTLTATWTINQYSITFDTAGGSVVSAITQDYLSDVSAPANPTKEGYTFNGWDQSVPTTMPSNDLTLTATWTINQYSITFDTAGGSAVSTITQDYQSDVSAPANPTKEGYTFNGWDQSVPTTMPSNDLTLTATWSINSYTVTYDVDGTLTTEVVNYQGTLQNIPTPTKEGYTFVAWQIDESDVDLSTYVQSIGDITIVATFLDATPPLVTGVVNETVYQRGSEITINYNEGTATLNGVAFTSGTVINTPGDYTLVVTDSAGNVTTTTFTIEGLPMNLIYIGGGVILLVALLVTMKFVIFRKK